MVLHGLHAAPVARPISEKRFLAYSHVQDTVRITRWPVLWPLAVAAFLYLILLTLGNVLLNDPDTHWHITLGQWIITHHQVPLSDVLSYTMNGKPWISSEWLAEVLYAKAFNLGGWSAVVILTAAAIASAFGLVTRFLLERLALTPALLLTTGAFMLASPHFLARPHALAYPIMVAWVAGLVRALDERRPPPFALLPLMTLWANLHGSFTLGLALLAPVVLEALWNAPSQRTSVALRWGLFGILAIVAASVTPYGPESILVTFRVLGLGRALALIPEWQPQDFATVTSFQLCLLLSIGVVLYLRLTLPPTRIVVVLGLLYMALSHVRNGEVLGLLAPLFIAAPLAPQIKGCDGRQTGECNEHLLPSLALILTLFLVTVDVSYTSDYQPQAAVTPARAVAALKASGAKHVLNSYIFGGYLIASGIKPFIDGRTELYGEKFVLSHDRAVKLRDLGAFFSLLKNYDIDATMLAPNTPAVGLLDRLKGWKRVYTDDVAVVHLKTGAPHPEGAAELRP